ncbi:hypothetical protein DWG18_11220 [Lysobacter sp. TY2-98]|uniref:hypothetical protein n=1 Tax=Lysobacter sp. TY2-98 TaxID=2290922 RepID=UPI000E201AEE|nr:hypothetical protein [Lysobacter sp. TY2-98]AXK72792.1 hypothetical protein DWG18_11220 [Lysobacter sp. TY2-98]
MDKLFALFAFLASLIGCDGGRDTVVHRIVGTGADVLFSRATVQDGVARFDCVRSASGPAITWYCRAAAIWASPVRRMPAVTTSPRVIRARSPACTRSGCASAPPKAMSPAVRATRWATDS